MNIVILTGAGISAESGIPTFRSSDGLWNNYKIEEVATPEGFHHNPKLVQDFYNDMRRSLVNFKPNKAHEALVQLESRDDYNIYIITQNIDNLHEVAGSRNIIHMHGELLKSSCTRCGNINAVANDISISDICPICKSRGTIRPHIVWFGELPFEMDKIMDLLQMSDLFISIGTSGVVYPAASFARAASMAGAKTVELNLEPSNQANIFDECVYGPATVIVPSYVDKILNMK